MYDLEPLLERAYHSQLFTAPRIEGDLRTFLDRERDRVRRLAREVLARGTKRVYFAGSGNSWANMLTGKRLLDRYTTMHSDAVLSFDLTWREPVHLDEDALVFAASYSGATEDTLAAARFAKERGARVVAIVRSEGSPIADTADETIAYENTALWEMPLAVVTLFAAEIALAEGRPQGQDLIDGLEALPPLLGRVSAEARDSTLPMAHEYLNSQLMYTIGAGPLHGLAYKYGLTVFMENMRVNGSFIESAEFRHGPAEMMERQRADFVVLLGTDASRALTERTLEIVKAKGGRALVFDMAGVPGVHEELAPFVLQQPLQWFAVYSSLLRGITDLDARVLMGRRVLSSSSWP
jgi:fructoselysine-6-P-deglycase FrlB-like protein